MKWKYYIPHVWESPEARTIWEDVWLLPDSPPRETRSYWFTLDALGPANSNDPYLQEWRQYHEAKLGDRDYLITDVLDLLIPVQDFNLHELLEWTKFFIQVHFDDPEPELVLGTFDEFSNRQAGEIRRIRETLQEKGEDAAEEN